MKQTKNFNDFLTESASDEDKYLTPKQKKLPEALKKSIIKKKKKSIKENYLGYESDDTDDNQHEGYMEDNKNKIVTDIKKTLENIEEIVLIIEDEVSIDSGEYSSSKLANDLNLEVENIRILINKL